MSSEISIVESPVRFITGRLQPCCHDHVLRNHNVGSTWSDAWSGPRFVTEMRISRSSMLALAYSI